MKLIRSQNSSREEEHESIVLRLGKRSLHYTISDTVQPTNKGKEEKLISINKQRRFGFENLRREEERGETDGIPRSDEEIV